MDEWDNLGEGGGVFFYNFEKIHNEAVKTVKHWFLSGIVKFSVFFGVVLAWNVGRKFIK